MQAHLRAETQSTRLLLDTALNIPMTCVDSLWLTNVMAAPGHPSCADTSTRSALGEDETVLVYFSENNIG